MRRDVSVVCLGLMLLWGSTACVPKARESLLSEHGYRVSLDVSDTLLWIGPGVPGLPETAEVIVRVRDAQERPVDGMAVVFSVDPSWTQNVSFTPPEARTQHGEAHTIVQVNTTGHFHVMAHVDNVTPRAALTVVSRPSPSGNGS
jgi:hypothetical protein